MMYFRDLDSVYDDIETVEGAMSAKMKKVKPRKTSSGSSYDRNRYYVGHPSVLDRNWGHATLGDAINHADEVMAEQERDEVFIVQIIRIVRRRRAPVEVVKL